MAVANASENSLPFQSRTFRNMGVYVLEGVLQRLAVIPFVHVIEEVGQAEGVPLPQNVACQPAFFLGLFLKQVYEERHLLRHARPS